MNDDADDEIRGEIELRFEPRADVLEMFAIEEHHFDVALFEALEKHEELCRRAPSDAAIPELEDLELLIDGYAYRLGNLADISISGDVDLLDDD